MPTKIGLKTTLPTLLTRPMYEILLTGFVYGRTTLGPAFQVSTAVEDFMTKFNISHEDWDVRTAIAYIYNNFGCENEIQKENLLKIIEQWEKKKIL